jgi:hypothetical protein
MELVPFTSWADVLAYAQTGEPIYYKAPMDRYPARLTPSNPKARSPFTYQAQTRTIKVWPSGSVGRGRNRTADPFSADAGHLDRFLRPVEAGVRETGGQVAAHRDPVDEHAATELVLYIENTSELSPDGPSGQGRNILLGALRKWRKGTYDPKLAVKLFEYLAVAGAKQYAKEFDDAKNWSTIFTPATRHEAAKQLEASFRNSAEHGEYDHVDTHLTHFTNEVGARRKRPPERPAARERKHSMTYGVLPPFEQFTHDVHTRVDPDYSDGRTYWPAGSLFPMELVSAHEIELAQDFGLDEFRTERHRTGRNTRAIGFQGDERQIYDFLEFLVEAMNNGDDEAGDLASTIMSTLGYEWI